LAFFSLTSSPYTTNIDLTGFDVIGDVRSSSAIILVKQRRGQSYEEDLSLAPNEPKILFFLIFSNACSCPCLAANSYNLFAS